jgi:hypothetical protein
MATGRVKATGVRPVGGGGSSRFMVAALVALVVALAVVIGAAISRIGSLEETLRQVTLHKDHHLPAAHGGGALSSGTEAGWRWGRGRRSFPAEGDGCGAVPSAAGALSSDAGGSGAPARPHAAARAAAASGNRWHPEGTEINVRGHLSALLSE